MIFKKNKKNPTVLVILDGWGVAPPSKGNAITLAKKPTLDKLFKLYPSTTLGATGTQVGLEDHKMSGSESGHMNIGAGRVVPQDSFYITESIKDKTFFTNPAMIGATNHVKKFGGKMHLMGLMGNSDSPHSDPEHFRAVLRLAKEHKIKEVYCHLFTDGRDSYPKSALEHLAYFKQIIAEEGIGKIATLSGRFYAMDRAKNWKRLTLAYDAMVLAHGEMAASPEEAIERTYRNGLNDEYMLPTVLLEKGKPVGVIGENDSIISYNLRSDRARQFAKLFVLNNKCSIAVDNMPIISRIKNLYFTAMTSFGPDLDTHIAFPSHTISGTLPMVLGNLRQLYTAESEKYAHVTYFFNGG
jgi:2,3-bisphosphoglycerate-independent phosphoglycerate mutase